MFAEVINPPEHHPESPKELQTTNTDYVRRIDEAVDNLDVLKESQSLAMKKTSGSEQENAWAREATDATIADNGPIADIPRPNHNKTYGLDALDYLPPAHRPSPTIGRHNQATLELPNNPASPLADGECEQDGNRDVVPAFA
eukprot:CAMPEP_0117693890 /NCGR_PEP_ID=MMETSP0804-20121206/27142_1 /TAXON_ID=1074897 /ORGANISM="Tetraselmis astigmatica, Strain CCMP880" /LENGTH=141 /DNA_ID=CAMNT_0005507515 /DNA_START=214 /DNA_END=644 /DNA_ORIENTATION=-